jgi:hypothetical protein
MSTVELGELNLRNGKNDVAFEIFFDLAQYELSADAQFALIKMCSDGLLKTDQIESLMTWLNRESGRGSNYIGRHEKKTHAAEFTSKPWVRHCSSVAH